MNLEPTAEQQQIVQSASAYLAKRMPMARLRGIGGRGGEGLPPQWQDLADMGWLGMAIPESAGGVGYRVVEEMLVFRELGRVLAPPRILASAVAAKVAAEARNLPLAREIAAGRIPVALALQDDFSVERTSLGRRMVYEIKDAPLVLVFDGDLARLLDISGLTAQGMPGLDKSVSLATANLEKAPIVCAADAPQARHEAVILTAALLLGQAELARDMINEYAKIRQTFGRPIGAYQAVRHPIAEMAVKCEAAKNQLFVASLIVSLSRSDAAMQASMARILCFAAALKNADDNIQLHGGIGVTDEFCAHLLIKRAHLLSEWFGSNRDHLESILDAPIRPY
jgi:alkylation response protein AidB-like acyl-CoA dehydrogenase